MSRAKNKKVYGVGINDADYQTNNCPIYWRWKGMLCRGYSKKLKDKYTTYEDCSVCDEWLYFMTFRAWVVEQDWEGKQLDKDILLRGNKVYCPEYCVFVDRDVNTFITDSKGKRGEWPLGVSFQSARNKFRADCKAHTVRKTIYLGLFTCPQEAHQAWCRYKHSVALQLAELQTDTRVAEALRTRYAEGTVHE